jgi:hypothetical protein
MWYEDRQDAELWSMQTQGRKQVKYCGYTNMQRSLTPLILRQILLLGEWNRRYCV